VKKAIESNAASILRCIARKKQKTFVREIRGEEKLLHTGEKKALDSSPPV